jgi:hypothetical protein
MGERGHVDNEPPFMNHKVGRAVLCAPRRVKDRPWFNGGAHGVTRPTLYRFRGSTHELFREILSPLRRGEGVKNSAMIRPPEMDAG